jgi:hypothetical protein
VPDDHESMTGEGRDSRTTAPGTEAQAKQNLGVIRCMRVHVAKVFDILSWCLPIGVRGTRLTVSDEGGYKL